jgi:FAD synthetase
VVKKVVAMGSFDILHCGHLVYLKSAKKLGDYLVVIVARNSNIKKIKGREPVFDEEARREMVGSLKMVDKAVIGHRGDIYKILKEIRPDIIALGYDQKVNIDLLKKKLNKFGLKARIVRIKKSIDGKRFKSSIVLKKLSKVLSENIKPK